MDENKNPQTQPEAAQDPGKPLSEKRKAALLRYMTILFSAAFVLVLISLILQMHSSEAKISELNAASTSALSNAEALQAENRSLQDEKIALEQENRELQAKLDELNEKLDAASQAEEDAAAAENEMIKSLRTELDRTKEAYEALRHARGERYLLPRHADARAAEGLSGAHGAGGIPVAGRRMTGGEETNDRYQIFAGKSGCSPRKYPKKVPG